MEDRILAGITLYGPDIERLRQNLQAVSGQTEGLICIDNGSENIEEIECLLRESFPTALLKKNNRNLGVTKALNQIFAYGKEQGFSWVLTLDQDSVCPANLVEEYRRYLNVEKAALLCPVLMDRNCGLIPERIDASESPVRLGGEERAVFVEKCITSASLNCVRAWEAVGGFYEELFIDFVDHDYCARLREKGYKILQVNRMTLLHEMGHAKTHRLFGKKITDLNHSAFRKYYITRNWNYYMWRHRAAIPYRQEKAKYYFSFVKTILYEDRKAEKLRAMFRGARDGRKMVRRLKAEGKIQENRNGKLRL